MDINIGKYEFGEGGRNKKVDPEDLRTPNPRAVYGVKDSSYTSENWKKWGITKSKMEELFWELDKKIVYKIPEGCTIQQCKDYAHRYLGGFFVLEKFWPEAYKLLMQNDFKIYFITSAADWHKIYIKRHKDEEGHRAASNFAKCDGFFDPGASPPRFFINATDLNTEKTFPYTMLHETLHALDYFAGKYYGYNHLSDTFEIDSYVDDYNKRVRFVNKKLFDLSKKCKTEDEYNKKGWKLICDYRLWFIYYNCDKLHDFLPELTKDPQEFFVAIIMYYLLRPETLKSLDRGLYDFIEKEIKPDIARARANRGMTKQKLFKP